MSGLEVFGAGAAEVFDGTVDGEVAVTGLEFDGEDLKVKTYAFSMAGINFNDYEQIKILILPSEGQDDNPVTFQEYDEGGSLVDYDVPSNRAYIAFHVVSQINSVNQAGRIGESNSAGGALTREVLKFSDGSTLWFNKDILGVFRTGKWITAESTHNSYGPAQYTTLYGIEIVTT